MSGLYLDDYDFDLPDELVAQNPAPRGQSRLLVWNRSSGSLTDTYISAVADFLPKPSLMVFNDSRVRRARVLVTTESGRDSELVLLSRLGNPAADESRWRALTKGSRRLRNGSRLFLPDGGTALVAAVLDDGVRELVFDRLIDDAWLDKFGHLPLPPYIRREDGTADRERYQTVFARVDGSAAAPTAGLHFTNELLDSLREAGVQPAWVTLHVGLGTFLPVRSRNIAEHRMHEEVYSIPRETADLVTAAKASGLPIVACGTTSVRTLESAWDRAGKFLPQGDGATSIFIKPGHEFGVVDKLFTNFHTPKSSLLMLVSAFGGFEETRRVYRHAVEQRYRFFSYGDAMLIV